MKAELTLIRVSEINDTLSPRTTSVRLLGLRNSYELTSPLPTRSFVNMMNILEDQVSDLTHLVESPIATITPMGGTFEMNGRQSNSEDSPARENGKRKSEDQNTGGHTRAKRNRYISIAW